MQKLVEQEIQEIVDRETQAWNEKSTKLLLSVFHPDMAWVWPTDSSNHDPLSSTSIHYGAPIRVKNLIRLGAPARPTAS